MNPLLDHLTANAATPSAPPEPTLDELEAALAADPDNAELRTYVEERRRDAAMPDETARPTRIADLPPPIVVDLEPAKPTTAVVRTDLPVDPPRRGRPKGSRNKPVEPAPSSTYDAHRAERGLVVIECIRAGKSISETTDFLALLDQGGES